MTRKKIPDAYQHEVELDEKTKQQNKNSHHLTPESTRYRIQHFGTSKVLRGIQIKY